MNEHCCFGGFNYLGNTAVEKELSKTLSEFTKTMQDITQDINVVTEEKINAPKDKHLKPDWLIFPFEEADSVRKVFEYGVKKYGEPFTYRRGKGVPENDLWSAVFRHMLKIRAGEDIDPESLCLHWAHVAANALMAISTIKKRQSLT